MKLRNILSQAKQKQLVLLPDSNTTIQTISFGSMLMVSLFGTLLKKCQETLTFLLACHLLLQSAQVDQDVNVFSIKYLKKKQNIYNAQSTLLSLLFLTRNLKSFVPTKGKEFSWDFTLKQTAITPRKI